MDQEVRELLSKCGQYDPTITFETISHLHTSREQIVELGAIYTAMTMTANMHIFVKQILGRQILIHCKASDTISDIKERVEMIDGTPESQQRLILAGRALVDDKTLADYNIQKGTIVNMILALRGD